MFCSIYFHYALIHSILFCSVLPLTIPSNCAVLYSIYYTVFYSILFRLVLFCFILIYSTLFYSIPFDSIMLCSTLLYCDLFYFMLCCSALRCCTLVYFQHYDFLRKMLCRVLIFFLFVFFFWFLDRPTEVQLGIYINSFYSISEQTMVNTCMHTYTQTSM